MQGKSSKALRMLDLVDQVKQESKRLYVIIGDAMSLLKKVSIGTLSREGRRDVPNLKVVP